MPKRRAFLLVGAIALGSFLAGAAAVGWYGYSLSKQMIEGMLIDRTLVLRYLRQGDFKFAEGHVESIAWNQIISIGNGAARGEAPSANAKEAVAYHCERFEQEKQSLDKTLASQRAYWCNCVLTLRCSGSPSTSTER